MKKLLAIAAMATTLVSSASMVDWQYVGAAADKDASIYLYLGDSAPTTFADLDAVKASSVNTGKTVVESTNPRSGAKSYAGSGSAERAWTAGDKFYYVLVSADESTFYVDPTGVTVAAGRIYEKGANSPGTIATTTGSTTHTYAGFSGGGSGGGTDPLPEPTSGLLLLVGGAVLALRRKQK